MSRLFALNIVVLEPVKRNAVVIIDVFAPLRVIARDLAAVIGWRILKLRLGHGNDVAALVQIIGQRCPWQRMKFFANTQKTAKGHDGIGDLA